MKSAAGVALALCMAACTPSTPDSVTPEAGALEPGPMVNPSAAIPADAPSSTVEGDPLPMPVLPTAPKVDDICVDVCRRSAYLRCAASPNCVARCNQMRGMPGCEKAVDAMLGCYIKTASANWSCNAQGVAVLPPDVCSREQSRTLQCLSP
jgi:hypothetical protein